ncbi:DUF4129 domain-containing protein, partial [Bacteroides sp. OttesenSCG-928-J23]|nr:DUF4129 domain-containing protein [Bacteroides sp. OttesenSCG-928-J23]
MTLPNDTLVCDSARLASWQNNPLYDYNKELVAPDINLMEYISRWFARLMRTIFGSQFAEKYSDVFF